MSVIVWNSSVCLRDPPRPVNLVSALDVNCTGRVSTRVTPGGQGIRFLSSTVRAVAVLMSGGVGVEGLRGGMGAAWFALTEREVAWFKSWVSRGPVVWSLKVITGS